MRYIYIYIYKTEGKDKHKVKLHKYLNELIKITPRNIICWHPREYLHVICAKDVLGSRHGNSSIILDTRRPGVNLLLLLVPNPQPLITGSKLFDWQGWWRHPRCHEGWGRREHRKDWSASIRDRDGLSPNCKQGLVLLVPHPGIHVLIKLRRHFCKKRTLVNNYTSKHKKKNGNTDELNTYSFFPQYWWVATRKKMGLDLNNKTQESEDPQGRPNFLLSWCTLSPSQHNLGTYSWA